MFTFHYDDTIIGIPYDRLVLTPVDSESFYTAAVFEVKNKYAGETYTITYDNIISELDYLADWYDPFGTDVPERDCTCSEGICELSDFELAMI